QSFTPSERRRFPHHARRYVHTYNQTGMKPSDSASEIRRPNRHVQDRSSVGNRNRAPALISYQIVKPPAPQ
ncbi:MAG TPA: hypothetical protein VHI71_07740, partial [Actinomycetota bacterium]|nr:hypothetical protein [Actinomycetota bacterium]